MGNHLPPPGRSPYTRNRVKPSWTLSKPQAETRETRASGIPWDETIYEAVKNTLQTEGFVTPGRGRGGSVSLAD